MCTYISINAHFTCIKETMQRKYNYEPSKLTQSYLGTMCARHLHWKTGCLYSWHVDLYSKYFYFIWITNTIKSRTTYTLFSLLLFLSILTICSLNSWYLILLMFLHFELVRRNFYKSSTSVNILTEEKYVLTVIKSWSSSHILFALSLCLFNCFSSTFINKYSSNSLKIFFHHSFG